MARDLATRRLLAGAIPQSHWARSLENIFPMKPSCAVSMPSGSLLLLLRAVVLGVERRVLTHSQMDSRCRVLLLLRLRLTLAGLVQLVLEIGHLAHDLARVQRLDAEVVEQRLAVHELLDEVRQVRHLVAARARRTPILYHIVVVAASKT